MSKLSSAERDCHLLTARGTNCLLLGETAICQPYWRKVSKLSSAERDCHLLTARGTNCLLLGETAICRPCWRKVSKLSSAERDCHLLTPLVIMNYLLDEDHHSLILLGNHLSTCWEILGWGIPKVNKLSLWGRDYHLLSCLGRSLCMDCCLEGKSFSRTCRGNLSSCLNDLGIHTIKV